MIRPVANFIARLLPAVLMLAGTPAAWAQTEQISVPKTASRTIPGLDDARILPGWINPDKSRIAAIEFRLQPGWKTYWRSPGDSGLSPIFNWSESQNVKAVTLHWPAPEDIESGTGQSLGYRDRLLLPFTVIPARPGLPVDLSVSVDFGLCKDVCVPAHVALKDDHNGISIGTDADPVIQAAINAAPRLAEGKAVCILLPIDDGIRVIATMPLQHAVPAIAAMELTGSDAWISTASIAEASGATTLTADVVPPAAAPFDLPRDLLVFTLIGKEGATEIRGCA